jgi:Uma2 family endonuclease
MCAIVIANRTPENAVRIPDWVSDFESFRRWTFSDAFPEEGQFSYLDGELWVDLSMEQLFTHNQVKAAYTHGIMSLLAEIRTGRYVPDRMRLVHPESGLSTEPDGLFYAWETVRNGRLRLIETEEQGCLDLEGATDMVLEVVSATSVRKDTEILRDLYWRAGIPEYWLVDARKYPLRFEILRHTPEGYVAVESHGGWLRSEVFGRAFLLTQQTDPLGHPEYTLAVR